MHAASAPPRRSERVAEQTARQHSRAGRPRGVFVLRNSVSIEAGDAARLRRLVRGAAPIFNPDELRTQARLRDCALLRRLRKALVDASVLTDGLCMTEAVVLHSAAGCAQQPWHTDFDPIALKKGVAIKPAGVILAIEDKTYFEEYPDKKHVLDAGDVLVFDGDVVHAGSSYSKSNVRLHAYIDSCDVVRTANTTYLFTNKNQGNQGNQESNTNS